MSSIAITGGATGTGVFSLLAPSTSTNRTLTLPDSTGTVVVSGTSPSFNGIQFPATQVPSADANTLDDYEEGTWTPSVTSLGGTITTVGAVSGKYTKVGRVVVVNYDVAITTQGTGASALQIAGLPFANGDIASISCGREVNATGYITSGLLATSATTISVRYYDAAYPGTSGSRNYGTLTYQTT